MLYQAQNTTAIKPEGLSYGFDSPIELVGVFLFSILEFKDCQEYDTCEYCNSKHEIKTFHNYSSLSLGVIKYANERNMKNVTPNMMPTVIMNLPDIMLPMTPAVRVYFAASAKIVPIIFRLSLFTFCFLST